MKTALPARLRFVPWIALIAVLVGAFGFFRSRPPGSTKTLAAPSTGQDSLPEVQGEVELATVVAVTPPLGGRDELPPQAIEGSAEDSTGAPSSPEAGDSKVLVRVVLQDNPWLTDDFTTGSVIWAAEGYGTDVYSFPLEAAGGLLQLPAAPSGIDEFRKGLVGGLRLELLSLRPLEASHSGAVFELLTDWEEGATLIWSDSVPESERGPVGVAIGGGEAPSSREVYSGDWDDPALATLSELTLPLTLPRLLGEESVWVGAKGREWRAFAVGPDTLQVEVSLSLAASIQVIHDAAEGDRPQYLFVMAFPEGDSQRQAFRESGSFTFTERPVATHEVWVAETDDYESSRVSRLARIEVVAGETSVVDLTHTYAEEQLGGVRVHLHSTEEILGLAGKDLRVQMTRAVPEGADMNWERAGDLAQVQGGTATARVYELRGLESRPHRVIVQPFGKIASVDVVAGELQEIDLFLNELGWIELDLPDGYRSGSTFVSIATAEPNFADRSRFGHSKVGKLEKGAQAIPVAPGTYIVSVSTFNGSDQPPLRSDAFTVQAGATVAVELDALRVTSVSVVAEDVATGQPIALDIESWVSLSLVSAVTGEAHRGSMTFEGDRGSYKKIVWSPLGVDGLVRVIVPESPLWTFEDLPPFELVEGATVTLRARAK